MENTIERILVCNRDTATITDECLLGILPNAAPETASGIAEFEGLPIEEAVNRLERHLIERALDRSGYVQSRAADLLGTTRRILKYKMDQLDVDSGRSGEAEIA